MNILSRLDKMWNFVQYFAVLQSFEFTTITTHQKVSITIFPIFRADLTSVSVCLSVCLHVGVNVFIVKRSQKITGSENCAVLVTELHT